MKPTAKHMALSSTEIEAYDRIKDRDEETCPKSGCSHPLGKKCSSKKKK